MRYPIVPRVLVWSRLSRISLPLTRRPIKASRPKVRRSRLSSLAEEAVSTYLRTARWFAPGAYPHAARGGSDDLSALRSPGGACG